MYQYKYRKLKLFSNVASLVFQYRESKGIWSNFYFKELRLKEIIAVHSMNHMKYINTDCVDRLTTKKTNSVA
jgi:hypothetical protein